MSPRRTLLLSILCTALLSLQASALHYAAGSPCEPVCNDATAGTLTDDVRCLDTDYNSQPGSLLKDCVTCELNSSAVDATTGRTDVQWALFNLRYALSNCMFAYPIERVSISSPCQVTCAPLERAIRAEITNSTEVSADSADFGYCTAGQFDDTTINNCAFCYSFIPQQLFLGNFLQALHIACHSPPQVGASFYPDGRAIFNESTIAGPTTASAPVATTSGLSGYKLALAIALPIVGGIIILLATCACCWHFTRKRRQHMAASGRMSRFHDNQATGSGALYNPLSPKNPNSRFGYDEPPREMARIQVVPKFMEGPKKSSPGLAQGRWAPHGGEEGTPLNSADREAFGRDDIGQAPVQVDPELHEQFIGIAHGGPSQTGAFRAQDGLARQY